jgi:hypothetical protein
MRKDSAFSSVSAAGAKILSIKCVRRRATLVFRSTLQWSNSDAVDTHSRECG